MNKYDTFMYIIEMIILKRAVNLYVLKKFKLNYNTIISHLQI